MNIKWVSNSRVKRMVANGTINEEDVIPRGSTANYPPECATVAMRDVVQRRPWLSVHIRGAEQKQSNQWTGHNWIAAQTMRVNFGHDYKHKSLSGELSQELDFAEVDRAIKQIESAMEA